MRNKPAPAVVAAAALLAALAACAARASAEPRHPELAQAAARTAKQTSLSFQLTAELHTRGQAPYVLRARGATSGRTAHVSLKVDDVQTTDGHVLTGPSATEKTDGTFLYLRSSLTEPLAGRLWIREPLAKLGSGSPELRMLRQVSPRGLVQILSRARGVTSADGGRVFHAGLRYTDPIVAATLEGLEAGTQYRNLRAAAWVSPEGRVTMLLLTGRTADRSSTFLLTLTLSGFGHRVKVTPPKQGAFVDFDLSRLSQ